MAATLSAERITSTNHIFDELYRKIIRLEMLPGTKLSESEVAKTFGCSRQPVREAFTRLADLNLLLIRPQRATIVRHFSRKVITDARFIRGAIELEIIRQAIDARDTAFDAELKMCLKAQRAAISAEDTETFHDLDYEFHKLLCHSGKRPSAFKLISANKAQVDRLCMLSLTSPEAMEALFQDHTELFEAILSGDQEKGQTILRSHLSRLDPILDAIYTTHGGYFEE